jgi:hypothetical protein
MQETAGVYDPALLAVVRSCNDDSYSTNVNGASLSLSVRFADLAAGMILRSNVETRDGTLVLGVGHQLSEMTLQKLRNFERVAGIKEPIQVENYRRHQ